MMTTTIEQGPPLMGVGLVLHAVAFEVDGGQFARDAQLWLNL
jgi:hypothetical protein